LSSIERRAGGSTPTSKKAPEIGQASPPGKRKLRKIFTGCLSGHQMLLIGEVRRGRLVCDEGQLEVIDNPVHHGVVC
jgi:hypothetical protein